MAVANDLDLRVRLLGDSSDLDAATRDGEQSVGRLTTVMAGLGVAGAAGGAALSVGFARAADLEEGQAKLQAQLGLTAEEAGEYGGLAGSIYADNFGADMGAVNEAIRAVQNNLGSVGDIGEEAFTAASEAALTLADVMGVEVSESTAAAAALVKNGLAKDSAEAFDILTAGFQGGADKAGDFLDTITEYGPQFSKLGIDGEQALSILQGGLKAGARDTDVIADAFKEFSLRAIDGSDAVRAGYKAIGFDAKATAADIAAGGERANDATYDVIVALSEMKDPVKQNAAGVALFGTQWEDTLRTIIPGMAEAYRGTVDTAGATEQMTSAMGTTGKARVEEFRRELDMWVQSQVAGTGASSTAVAAIGSFGPAALTAAGSLGAMVTGLAALNVGTALARAGQIAASVATGVWTAAQWLLNVALTANPIGLVIVGVAALIAIFVIAYRRSDTFRAFVQRLWLALRVGAAAAWGALRAFGARFAGWVVGLVQRGVRVVRWFRELPQRVRDGLSNARTLLAQKGRDIVAGLWEGIRNMGDWIRGRVSSFIQNSIVGPIQNALKFGSPSKVARQWGRWTGQGLGLGLADSTTGVQRAATSLAATAVPRPTRPLSVAPGGGDVVHLHVGTMITDDRQLVQRIEQARRATSRSRTVARPVVARVGA